MMKIYTTPCVKVSRSRFKFLKWLFPDKKIYKRQNNDNRLSAAGKALRNGEFEPEVSETPLSLYEQSCFARRTRQHIRNILEQPSIPGEVPGPAASVTGILEEVSRNIAKMDQNLYSAKSCMEEILRAGSARHDSVSLN
ncbi:MAG: hypothetical protein PHV82_02395 [Victivallaceae bacterium]|nr:hypothetical protein [Victivallaceae bacterium]